MSASVERFRRFTLWPILDDDGAVGYWDIYEPCGCARPSECECAAMTSEPVATADTVAEARRIVIPLAREWRQNEAVEMFFGGRR